MFLERLRWIHLMKKYEKRTRKQFVRVFYLYRSGGSWQVPRMKYFFIQTRRFYYFLIDIALVSLLLLNVRVKVFNYEYWNTFLNILIRKHSMKQFKYSLLILNTFIISPLFRNNIIAYMNRTSKGQNYHNVGFNFANCKLFKFPIL